MEARLTVNGLSYERDQYWLFTDLSFTVTPGTLLIIQGENGSGKSTLLKLLAQLSTPTLGTIKWQDKLIDSLKADYFQHLHYVSHQNGLHLNLTTIENLKLQHYLQNKNYKNIDFILKELHLPPHQLVKYLSAGQKRKIALSKLLSIKKTLWILDEPFTALDQKTTDYFCNIMTCHLENKGMIILSTHQTLPIKSSHINLIKLSS